MPQTYIDSYYAVSNIKDGRMEVEVAAENLQQGDVVRVELLEGGIGYNPEKPGDKVLGSAEACGVNGKAKLDICINEPELWSPDSPYLYGIRISVSRNGKVIDSVDGYTAMREIAVCQNRKYSKRMALNGNTLGMTQPRLVLHPPLCPLPSIWKVWATDVLSVAQLHPL